MHRQLSGRVTVLSAHLDDAVLSVGAALAGAARAGADVTVATVFAGDPGSAAPASWWDEKAGFRTEGEAARIRREEDARACALVGARPVWLPFADAASGRTADDETVWAAVTEAAAGADLVLVPGWPLEHDDHAWLHDTVVARGIPSADIAFYVEQPYALRRREAPQGPWHPLPSTSRDRRVKRRACLCYRSQLPLFARAPVPLYDRLLVARLAGYERRHGELVIQSRLTDRAVGVPAAAS